MPSHRDSSAEEEQMIWAVINDIVDYDCTSFATSSERVFDGSEYHPYDRRLGGSDSNTYQSNTPPSYVDNDPDEDSDDKR